MESYKNTWCIFPWCHENGEDIIHPDDLNRFKERFLHNPNGLFFCVDDDSEYITLKYKDELFRVKPILYKRVKMPSFSYGDYLILKNYPNSLCVVDDVRWHNTKSEPYYTLIVDGKKKSKRYCEKEFDLD